MSEKIQATEDNHLNLADVEHDAHHHTELPSTALSNILDAFVDRVGSYFSWLWIATVLVIIYSVVSRYAFGQGSVFLEELAWHLAGAAWLVGLSYTLVHDDHVRVDVLHERFSLKTQAWFEFIGPVQARGMRLGHGIWADCRQIDPPILGGFGGFV